MGRPFSRRGVVSMVVMALAGLGLTALAAPPASAAAASGAYSVCDYSNFDLGAIHVDDGVYDGPNYDGKLPPGQCSRGYFGWPHTAGVWVAGGFTLYICNHADLFISKTYGGYSGATVFFNNPNETYKVHTLTGNQPGLVPGTRCPVST